MSPDVGTTVPGENVVERREPLQILPLLGEEALQVLISRLVYAFTDVMATI
jgi:hypothetical protein